MLIWHRHSALTAKTPRSDSAKRALGNYRNRGTCLAPLGLVMIRALVREWYEDADDGGRRKDHGKGVRESFSRGGDSGFSGGFVLGCPLREPYPSLKSIEAKVGDRD